MPAHKIHPDKKKTVLLTLRVTQAQADALQAHADMQAQTLPDALRGILDGAIATPTRAGKLPVKLGLQSGKGLEYTV